MKKFHHLLPPQASSPAQFGVYWVPVKEKNLWFLAKDGDINFVIGEFGKGTYNQKFWFDHDYEAWGAIMRYYQNHGEPFPYMKKITERFIAPAMQKELLAIYGEDNMWWKKDNE